MFCENCGTKNDNNENFCTKCGNDLREKEGTITFHRISQFYGVLVPITICLDGNEVASLSVNEEITVPVSFGTHKIAFKLWSGNSFDEIELSKEHPSKKVNVKLGFGLITSNPKIASIEDK